MSTSLIVLGAVVALLFFISAILVFAFRLAGRARVGYWIGYFELALAVPLLFLLLSAPKFHPSALYYVQLGCILAWLLVEALLDYIFRVDFRRTRWMVIAYVILFFAGTGGLLGIAVEAGRGWALAAIILFLVMGVLAFVQREVTGA